MLKDTDLLGTNDAMVWAKEFCERFAGKTVMTEEGEAGDVDPGLMVGWFACAMQAQSSFEYKNSGRLQRFLDSLDEEEFDEEHS